MLGFTSMLIYKMVEGNVFSFLFRLILNLQEKKVYQIVPSVPLQMIMLP